MKKSISNYKWCDEIMGIASDYFPFKPKIQIEEVTYFGYRQGFKVYIDGKKYPRKNGNHYTYMTPFHAVRSAIKYGHKS